jgi:small subunit ribosomal protein S4e
MPRGGKHQKRIAKPNAIPITDKKANVWITKSEPGPHPASSSIPLVVLLKDVLGFAKTNKEARTIIVQRRVEVDGVVRCEEKFPVGLMDAVSFPKAGKHYRITVDWKGRLKPLEIEEGQAKTKIIKVRGKHAAPGKKFNLSFHDGRNMFGDNHIHPGDSIVVALPEAKMQTHLKLENGARCLVREGKHAGTIVKLNEIIPRAAGKSAEAKVSRGDEEFVTIADYLFVVDENFKVDS